MSLDAIRSILQEHREANEAVRRNLVKDYLQTLALSFLYQQEQYQQMVFFGGSALRHCYGLPRLSEDIDFVDFAGKVSLTELAHELKDFYAQRSVNTPFVKTHKFRVYLKFPILRVLGLASMSQSDSVFVKAEVAHEFEGSEAADIRIVPIFREGVSLLVKTFDLPTLMAGKINAILHRRWKKMDREGHVLAVVKGRDYFDLMWLLEKGIEPNWRVVESFTAARDASAELLRAIDQVDERSILYDLSALIEDQQYVRQLASHLKEIVVSKVREQWK